MPSHVAYMRRSTIYSNLLWRVFEALETFGNSHKYEKGTILLGMELRGLYSSPSRETLRRQKKWGGPSASPSTERSVVHSSPATVNVLQPCAEGVPSRLGSLLAFCLWEAWGGEGGARPKKKIRRRLPIVFLLAPPPKPQGPVALCLLSPLIPLIWPLVLPY